MKKVLVYGWYNQSNIGDDLFTEAFKTLFPEFNFTFCDAITKEKVQDVDAIFFGGGSFLGGKPIISDDALDIVKSKKIFYIGIGAESNIHPIHIELLKSAQLIATRSPDQVDQMKSFNSKVLSIPDIVYCLQDRAKTSQKKEKSILIIPNILVVPQNSDPHWKHAAWSYFKSEFTQFLDWLVNNDYEIGFLSLCHGSKTDDNWAISELLIPMERRNKKFILPNYTANIEDLTSVFSKYSCVITQRFHGIVLSEISRVPYIAIHHHDKLRFCKPNDGIFLSYYNLSKQSLVENLESAMKIKFDNEFPTESTIFQTLRREVLTLI